MYFTACRGDLSLDRDRTKDADCRRPQYPVGRGCTDPEGYSTLRERNMTGGRGAGEPGAGPDGMRHPPSGMSHFSVTDLNSSPSVFVQSSSETTPPPPLTQSSTATVLARYWPPPDGQSGRHTVTNEGIISTPSPLSHCPVRPSVRSFVRLFVRSDIVTRIYHERLEHFYKAEREYSLAPIG